jgi:hypothetical protein
MLELPDVMLCAVDTINVALTVAAMQRCTERICFGDVLLITHEPIAVPFRTQIIPPIASHHDYSEFICRQLAAHTTKDFNLLVQWDGFVLDSTAWRAEFLNCDYIGAQWPWHRDGLQVGNGGFCLRSRKLLREIAKYPLPSTAFSDDEFMCRTSRPQLERSGIVYASPQLADVFSYEHSVPQRPTFGFHGIFNMWRHVGDDEMADIADKIGEYHVTSRAWAQVIEIYFALRKFDPLRAFYGRLRSRFTAEQVHDHLCQCLGGDQARVVALMTCCEGLL